MKIRKINFFALVLLVIFNCFGENSYDVQNIEVKPMEYAPPIRNFADWHIKNGQIVGPWKVRLYHDLKTGCLLIRCYCYDYDVEDSATAKIENITLVSGGRVSPIAGQMSRRLEWMSKDPIKLLNIQEGDTIKGTVSGRIGIQEYIYRDVHRDSETKAHGIDFKIQPCPHGDCYKSLGLPSEQKNDMKCISVKIDDKEQFKEASIRSFLQNTTSRQRPNTRFRLSGDKSEICFYSFPGGEDAFPIEVGVIKYEPASLAFSIECSPQKLYEDAIAGRNYLREESGYYWKRNTVIVISVLFVAACTWYFLRKKQIRSQKLNN